MGITPGLAVVDGEAVTDADADVDDGCADAEVDDVEELGSVRDGDADVVVSEGVALVVGGSDVLDEVLLEVELGGGGSEDVEVSDGCWLVEGGCSVEVEEVSTGGFEVVDCSEGDEEGSTEGVDSAGASEVGGTVLGSDVDIVDECNQVMERKRKGVVERRDKRRWQCAWINRCQCQCREGVECVLCVCVCCVCAAGGRGVTGGP